MQESETKELLSTLNLTETRVHRNLLYSRAAMAQWWEHSPPTSVARVLFPDSASYVGWVCCWFSSLPRKFFSGYSDFPLSSKANISKYQFDLESEGTELSVLQNRLWNATLVKQNLLFIIIIFTSANLENSLSLTSVLFPLQCWK